MITFFDKFRKEKKRKKDIMNLEPFTISDQLINFYGFKTNDIVNANVIIVRLFYQLRLRFF